MSTDVRIRRIFCNKCGGLTRHILRAKYHHAFDSSKYEEMHIDFADGVWEIWQCQGCDEVVFLESWSLEGDEGPSETFYPERATKLIKEKSFKKIPPKLNAIYAEVIKSFNSGCYILCAGGLRALLEGICLNKGIRLGPTAKNKSSTNLEGKINGLKAIIPTNIADNLHGFRFLGNKALHELEIPSAEDVTLAIEVIEDVLNVIYELDYKSGRLMELISGTVGLSATQIKYREFWESLLDSFKEQLPEVTKSKSLPQSWISIPTGYGDIHLEWAFHGRPRAQFEVGLHLERADKNVNQEILHKLEAEITRLELEIGEKLTFQEQWGSKWSRIYVIRNEGKMTEELKKWAVDTMIKFYKVFKPRLDSILKTGNETR